MTTFLEGGAVLVVSKVSFLAHLCTIHTAKIEQGQTTGNNIFYLEAETLYNITSMYLRLVVRQTTEYGNLVSITAVVVVKQTHMHTCTHTCGTCTQ